MVKGQIAIEREKRLNNGGDHKGAGICTAIDSCAKIRMVLDKDFAFDWMYASEIKRECRICTSGVKAAGSSHKKKKVVLEYS